MLRHLALVTSVLLIFSSSCDCQAEPGAADRPKASAGEWIQLFDGKSLAGWYVNLGKQKRNEDPTHVFQVNDGVIHVYKDHPDGGDVSIGYLATDQPYAYFHLRLEYKWGTKKFRPRTNLRRDAGLLYHVVPPDAVWPRSLECQIQEHDVGDCFTVRGTQVATHAEIAEIETQSGPKKLPRYKSAADGGEPKTIGGSQIARVVKSAEHERDGWNTVEVIVCGSEKTTHLVNGHVVFAATDLRQLAPDKESWLPLEHGRILLQAEYSEVLYRNIEIRPIPEGPLHPTVEK